jgi:hypothetical protein
MRKTTFSCSGEEEREIQISSRLHGKEDHNNVEELRIFFFTMIVTQTMVFYVKWDGGAQEIPVQFLRETKLHIPTNGEISWIALVDSSNKLWQVLSKQVVECNKQQQNRLQLSPEGWAHFALDHILEEGDACVFELLSNSPELPMFRVHIFRALLPTLDDDDTSKLVIADRLC